LLLIATGFLFVALLLLINIFSNTNTCNTTTCNTRQGTYSTILSHLKTMGDLVMDVAKFEIPQTEMSDKLETAIKTLEGVVGTMTRETVSDL
jgi:hypothetical protein